MKIISAEELLNKRISEEAVSMEKIYFYKTDRMVNPRVENPFKYLQGSIPLLVSAPHAVRHKRKKDIKPSDEFTGATACLLHQLTGCHTLAVSKVYNEDPNFDYPSLYKDYLGEICKEHKIKLVLDLHGAARERDFAVDLGTIEGKSLLGQEGLTNYIIKAFRKQGLNEISSNFFSAGKQPTVTWYVSQVLGIPAIQVEVNKEYRVPRQNPQAYCKLLAALAETIQTFIQHRR
ncbi:MAG TPA: hypothetical protein VHS59_08955 [Bacillota bacterium]|nr:hypothetical protein [Bacillota bacterium]